MTPSMEHMAPLLRRRSTHVRRRHGWIHESSSSVRKHTIGLQLMQMRTARETHASSTPRLEA
uniref:Uncharacterized protein n=1 Tax=Arundo donax TaxID=35708 RepID=A0A0A9IJV8_ARUDO